MSEWGECVTHHACDCIQQKVERLEAESARLRDANHCCQQYADLSGLSVDEVRRLGSCGCVQAKAERGRYRAALERIAKQHNGDELNVALDALNGGTDD